MKPLKSTRENFNLKTVNYNREKIRMKIIYNQLLPDGAQIYKEDTTTKRDIKPDPDFIALLDGLDVALATLHGLLDVSAVIKRPEFEATKAQLKHAETHRKEKLEFIKVDEVTLSGDDDDTKGIVLSGTYNGQPIKTRKIYFSSDSLGFEKDLKRKADLIIEEVWAYMHEGKKAQLDLMDIIDQDKEIA